MLNSVCSVGGCVGGYMCVFDVYCVICVYMCCGMDCETCVSGVVCVCVI